MVANSLEGQLIVIRIATYLAAIYLFVLPFGHLTALRNTSFTISLLLCVWVWIKSQSKELPLKFTFLLWFSAACISMFWTLDRSSTIDAIGEDIVKSFATFFVFYVLTRDARSLQFWLISTALCLLTICALAVITVPIQGPWTKGYLPPRGEFATFALTVVPLLLAAIFSRSIRSPWLISLVGAALIATVLAGYLTKSRAFWLGLIAIAGVTFAFQLLKWKKTNLVSVIGLAMLVFLSIVLAGNVAEQRGRTLSDLEDRNAIYPHVIKKIRNNPWYGTGFGHETDKKWYSTNVNVKHAHNVVLSYADQMGVIGLLVLAFLFFAAVPQFFEVWYASNVKLGLYGLFGIAMVVAVFLKNNFDIFFVGQPLWVYFAHLGIFLGLVRRNDSTRDAVSNATPEPDSEDVMRRF